MLLLVIGCVNTPHLEMEEVSKLKTSLLDSLKCNNRSLGNILVEKPSIIYISNNECSECIYKLIDFHNQTSKIEGIQRIYIIYGYDNLSFNYYIKQENVIFSKQDFIIEDSLDFFHDIEKQYIGNQIFFSKNNKMIRLLSDPLKDKISYNEFRKLISLEN